MEKKKLPKAVFIPIIVFSVLIGILLLAWGGLNIIKYPLYSDYYGAKTNLCTNPGLDDGFICQGIAYDDGSDLVLVSGYMADGSASRIYVTTLDDKSHYVSLTEGEKAFTGHAGGIAVSGGKLYIATGYGIYILNLSDITNAENGASLDVGEKIHVNNKASFCYTDDTYLYVGEFHDGGKYNIEGHDFETAEGTHYAICSRYALSDPSKPDRVYSIRDKVQGICFMPDGKIVMSTSYGITSSVYYVYEESDAVNSGKTVDGAPVYYLDKVEKQFNGPAMAEGLDYLDGKVITLTESASNKYIFGKFFFANKIVVLDIK